MTHAFPSRFLRALCVAAFGLACVPALAAQAQLPDFTYQGRLQQNGQPANGNFNLDFALYDAETGGNQVGSTVSESQFPVTDGLFTVDLAFPGAFDGTQLWLQVSVNGQALSPRQAITATPVAQYALHTASDDPHVVHVHAGQSIQAALDAITDNATTPYLIRVGPGIFNERVTMKPNVDIEGSGEGITFITAGGGNSASDGTVTGASNATIRNLTIENTGGGGNDATAFAVTSGSSRLDHVQLLSENALFNGYGIYASGSGAAVQADDVDGAILGAGNFAYAAYADSGGRIDVRGGSLSAPTGSGATSNDVLYDGGGGTLHAADSMLDGPVSGAVVCVGAFKPDYTALGSNCN